MRWRAVQLHDLSSTTCQRALLLRGDAAAERQQVHAAMATHKRATFRTPATTAFLAPLDTAEGALEAAVATLQAAPSAAAVRSFFA